MAKIELPESNGVLSRRQIMQLVSSGGISFVNNYSPDISPTMMSLLLVGEKPCKDELFSIEPGQARLFDLNVILGGMPECFHFFADGKTTSARVGFSVDILDSEGRMLPYQASSSYPDHVTPHPAKGGLRIRITSTQFPETMQPGSAVANLRIFYGDPEEAILNPLNLGQFVYIDSKPVPHDQLKTREEKFLELHLNLEEAVHNGTAGYVARDRVRDRIKYFPGANRNNRAADFFVPTHVCNELNARNGKLHLLYTLEEVDLTGGDHGYPFIAEMRRNPYGSPQAINMATMCEPEPPKRLAVEIRPTGVDMTLHHGQYIGDMVFYRGSETLDVKTHNSGNRHPLGKKFC